MPIGGLLATWTGGYPLQFFGVFGENGLAAPGFIAKNEALSEQLFEWHGYAGLAVAALLVLHRAPRRRRRRGLPAALRGGLCALAGGRRTARCRHHRSAGGPE